eukprot:jgi/Mesvir1/14463/Mv05174-RA.1
MAAATLSSTFVGAGLAVVARPARQLRRASVCVRAEGAKINQSIQKDQEKVVTTAKTSEINGKAVYCRCWQSAKFPMCDGAHMKHNKATGDNIGPLIVQKD